MTNTLANPSMGFQSFRRADGGSPTAGMTEVWINATDSGAIFRGDVVMTSSTGGTNNSGAYITSLTFNGISNSTAGFLARGIFQGCYQYQPIVQRVVWSNFYNGVVTGSTMDIKAYVIDDPSEQFLVQASTKGAITSSFVGLNINVTFNASSGNTVTGYSNVTVESTSVTSLSSMPFRIVDFYSAYAPGGSGFGQVAAGTSQTNVVNGTDNGNVANMVIVRLNNCDRLALTARSS